MANEYADRTTLRSPLGRVRGLGSARSGVNHWWMQRISSVGLLPLSIWFVFAAAALIGAPHAAVVAWIARPFNAVLLLAFIGLAFYHTALGARVIIEDYTNQEWMKLALILGVTGLCWLLGIASALAVLRIALGVVVI